MVEKSKSKEKSPVHHIKDEDLKHSRKLNHGELVKLLRKGHYSIISAGRNGNNDKEKSMRPDDLAFRDRHLQLRDALEESGMNHTEVVGHYDSEEPSFLSCTTVEVV